MEASGQASGSYYAITTNTLQHISVTVEYITNN